MPAADTLLSAHGIGAILASDTTFKIIFNHGAADITVPPTANSTKGWIHFTIPPPPPGYTVLKEAVVNFSQSDGVTVTGIQAYQGNSQLLFYTAATDADKVQPNSPYPFRTASQYNGNGIVASIQVEFTSLPATLSLVSVGVVAYDS